MSSISTKNLPVGWSVAYVEEIADIKSGKRLPKGIGLTESDNGYPYIRVADMANGTVDLNNIMFVPREVVKFIKKYIITTNDIYISVAGTLGLVGIIPNELNNANLTENANRLTNLKCNKLFLLYSLQTENIKRTIQSVQTLGAQPKLAIERIKKFEIILPPTVEQQKIAQALTDADNYISALEKLIEKKKMIKEGLMVNLLTGKQRLKEFFFNEDGTAKGYKDSELGKIPEDWEIGNLGNLTTLKARIGWQGLTVAEYLDQGDYYLVTGTDFNEGFIDFEHCPYVDKSRYSQDPNIQLKNNDVLVTKDGTIGKVAFIENLDLPATLNSGVFVIRPIGSGINSKFLYYILMSKYFDDFLKKITAGSTITHLYQKDFVHFDFVLPTLEEQNSIVSCLSNVDHDLMILERKLKKANNLKQGMMQKLLTGEIRLA